MSSTVLLERKGAVGIVTLNRPDRLNAMSTTLCRDLDQRLREAAADAAIRVVVLTGAGRAFCAGDDLKEFGEQTATKVASIAHIEAIQACTRAMMQMDKLVIGALAGYAVGGGFEWLVNCDMVVAAEDLVAFFPEMEWGQFVTGGVTHLLPQAVGHQRAMELMVLGERQTAADLHRLGLVNWVVPRAEMMAKAMAVAEAVAAKSAFSTSRLKRMLTGGIDDRLARAIAVEGSITIEAFGRPEAMERVARGFSRK
ncbi:MAG: enoyl-CoA hydratase/isomerase family protein [Hyphomicrobiaceae bacterium]